MEERDRPDWGGFVLRYTGGVDTEAQNKEIEEYIRGKRKKFSFTVKLTGTPFQIAVWRAVQKIPYGETRTYQEIARAIGRPTAVRAVANAIGANIHPILIPCHRVIRIDGSLGGYAWGITMKKKLLAIELAQSTKGRKR